MRTVEDRVVGNDDLLFAHGTGEESIIISLTQLPLGRWIPELQEASGHLVVFVILLQAVLGRTRFVLVNLGGELGATRAFGQRSRTLRLHSRLL